MTKLIVGLGNPGNEYELTRHNIGWDVMEKLSFRDRIFWKDKFKGLYAKLDIDGEDVYFLKPQTYMNLSGESVQPLMHFFKVELQDILVVHDELDLPYGTIAFKDGGGLAGHNGLKSIAACLGNQAFKRLRMGIGRPPRGSVSNWVLSTYSDDQKIVLDQYLEESAKAIELFIKDDFVKAQRKYNRKKIVE